MTELLDIDWHLQPCWKMTSWATGVWQTSAYSCEFVFTNDCSSVFNIPVFTSSFICYYCDPKACLCCGDYWYDLNPIPFLVVFNLFFSLFLVDSWTCCAGLLVLLSCDFFTDLVHLLMYVRVYLTVQCCSWYVVVSVTLQYSFSLIVRPTLSPFLPSVCHTPLPFTFPSSHSRGAG